MFFAGGNESVERKRIFAHVRVNQERDFGMEFTERGEGREWHLDEIADAAHIENDLIRSFFSEASAERSNHRSPVLPPFLRLSTHRWDSGYSRKKGTTPLGLSRFAPSSESRKFALGRAVLGGCARRRSAPLTRSLAYLLFLRQVSRTQAQPELPGHYDNILSRHQLSPRQELRHTVWPISICPRGLTGLVHPQFARSLPLWPLS